MRARGGRASRSEGEVDPGQGREARAGAQREQDQEQERGAGCAPEPKPKAKPNRPPSTSAQSTAACCTWRWRRWGAWSAACSRALFLLFVSLGGPQAGRGFLDSWIRFDHRGTRRSVTRRREDHWRWYRWKIRRRVREWISPYLPDPVIPQRGTGVFGVVLVAGATLLDPELLQSDFLRQELSNLYMIFPAAASS